MNQPVILEIHARKLSKDGLSGVERLTLIPLPSIAFMEQQLDKTDGDCFEAVESYEQILSALGWKRS